MALVCPNPRERLGAAAVQGAGGSSCTHYVDLPGYRNSSGESSRMSDHHRNHPCHSCSEAGQVDINRRGGSLQHDDHPQGATSTSHLLELDFTVGSKWNSNALPPTPISSWSTYMNTGSGHFQAASSSEWVVNPAPFPDAFPDQAWRPIGNRVEAAASSLLSMFIRCTRRP